MSFLFCFVEKVAFCQKCVCANAEKLYFPIRQRNSENLQMQPLGGGWGKLRKNVFFLLGACWVGGLVVFVLFPSFGSKSSLFLLVCFGFSWVVWVCVFFMFSGLVSFVLLVMRMVWFVFVFRCENKTNLCYPKRCLCVFIFCVSLPFSLVCLSLFLCFVFSSFLVFYLVSVAFLYLGFHEEKQKVN